MLHPFGHSALCLAGPDGCWNGVMYRTPPHTPWKGEEYVVLPIHLPSAVVRPVHSSSGMAMIPTPVAVDSPSHALGTHGPGSLGPTIEALLREGQES